MAVVGLYWASYTTAIQHYSWENLGAGKGIEPASPAWRGSNRRLPREVAKTKYLSKESIPGPLDGNSDALPIKLSVSNSYLQG
jgi:hypothetical protein